jgi:chemotaxis protein MotB
MTDIEDDAPEEEEKRGGWLTTWADMMSVLLTFFIVLQAFSTISEKKFYEAVSSIQRAFRVPLPIRAPGNFRFDTESPSATELDEVLEEEGADAVSVEDHGDRIVLTVNTGVLFEVGRADLTPAGQVVMRSVARVLQRTEGNIRIEGHTCDLPLGPGADYPDNWWLSTARAVVALEALQGNGVASQRLSAAGYGEFDPVAPNDGEANRARNRRVEFVVERGRSLADVLAGSE